MKLENKNANENVIVVGDSAPKTAKINQAKLAKLQYLLTNGLYSDGVGSTIVELTNNALDSIIQAGKDPMQNPVYVYIEADGRGKYQLRIVDNGLGLDESEFENVVMNYLTSTKEDSDDVIGAFGIGAKSWCSVSRNATFICTKDGVQRTFLCYKGPVFLEYDKLTEVETKEGNGVTVIVPIKDYWDKDKFVKKARQKLCYYDNVILSIDGDVVDNTIYRAEDFQWSTLNHNNSLHFSLKDVYYAINFEHLGIDEIFSPICLRFGLQDGIMPTPSREAIMYTDETIKLFKDKITKVAHWFKEKYDNTVEAFPNLVDAWEAIGGKNKYVKIEETQIKINDLLKFAKLTVREVELDGVKYRKPSWYKEKFDKMFFEYDKVSYLGKNGAWAKKYMPEMSKILTDDKRTTIVELKSTPTGRFKSFLREKYNDDTLFVVRRNKRTLGAYGKYKENSYYNILLLGDVPRESWREHIKEWQHVQETVFSKFEDGKELEGSEEFTEWIEMKKEEMKANRSTGSYSSNYKALNKEKGEITINNAREYKFGGKVVFDKGKMKIQELSQKNRLTIYFTKDEAYNDTREDGPDFIYNTLMAFSKKDSKGNVISQDIDIVWLNDREVKHVKHLKNWKTKEEFLKGKKVFNELNETVKVMFTKPLQRYVTANLISDYLDMIPAGHEDMIADAFPKYKEMRDSLRRYKSANKQNGSDELYQELKQLALQNNQVDPEIYPTLETFKKIMEDFNFLKFLEAPRHANAAQKKAVRNLIYTILKAKNVDCTITQNYRLVPVIEDVVPEEEIAYWKPKHDFLGQMIGHEDHSLDEEYVWLSKEKLLEEYPNCIPVALRQDDIKEPDVQDPLPDPEEEEEEEEEEELELDEEESDEDDDSDDDDDEEFDESGEVDEDDFDENETQDDDEEDNQETTMSNEEEQMVHVEIEETPEVEEIQEPSGDNDSSEVSVPINNMEDPNTGEDKVEIESNPDDVGEPVLSNGDTELPSVEESLEWHKEY
jgi:hypothetical protein